MLQTFIHFDGVLGAEGGLTLLQAAPRIWLSEIVIKSACNRKEPVVAFKACSLAAPLLARACGVKQEELTITKDRIHPSSFTREP